MVRSLEVLVLRRALAWLVWSHEDAKGLEIVVLRRPAAGTPSASRPASVPLERPPLPRGGEPPLGYARDRPGPGGPRLGLTRTRDSPEIGQQPSHPRRAADTGRRLTMSRAKG